MDRKTLIPIIVISVMWMAWGFLDRPDMEPEKQELDEIERQFEAAQQMRRQIRERNERMRVTEPASIKTTSAISQRAGISKAATTALYRFSDLNRKALLTHSETDERRLLLNSRSVLEELGNLLSKPSKDPVVMHEQDEAVDFLLDALQEGAVDVAAGVLGKVVQDGQIESSTLDSSVRSHLAGIKGEILYHWVALEPHQEARVAALLPGPVSKKIWQNVQELHASNAEISQEEVDQFH